MEETKQNRWYIFCQDELLLIKESGEYMIPCTENAPIQIHPWTTVIEPKPGMKCVAIASPVAESDEMCMMGLRKSYDVLPYEHYLEAGKARELLYWDQNSKFCGCCGAPMKFDTEISKKCTNCKKEIWPSLAIATIVIVIRDDKALLVHANNFRTDYFGLVAGFVETGESLEECVIREVHEETSVEIEDIRYFGSQPWPYPSGLMVGYYARYKGGDIHLQKSELSKGAWFDKEHLPLIPQKSSIARRLIDAWVEGKLDEGMPDMSKK